MEIILAVDPGEKKIGLAKSDPLGIGATPLGIIQHVRRESDAERIAVAAKEAGAEKILIGLAAGPNGEDTPAARHAKKLAEAIRTYFDGEIFFWDESGSTIGTKADFIEMGVSKKNRRGHLDANAAANILRDYLDQQYYKKTAG